MGIVSGPRCAQGHALYSLVVECERELFNTPIGLGFPFPARLGIPH
jgi:hypothetical protein